MKNWFQCDHREKQSDEGEDRLCVKVNAHVSASNLFTAFRGTGTILAAQPVADGDTVHPRACGVRVVEEPLAATKVLACWNPRLRHVSAPTALTSTSL